MADRGDRCSRCDSVFRFVMRIDDLLYGKLDLLGCVYCIVFILGPFETTNLSGKHFLIDLVVTPMLRRRWATKPTGWIETPEDYENVLLTKDEAAKLAKWEKQAASNSNQMDW